MSDHDEQRLEMAINKFAATHIRWILVCAFAVGVWMARMEYIYTRLADKTEWQAQSDAQALFLLNSRITALENARIQP